MLSWPHFSWATLYILPGTAWTLLKTTHFAWNWQIYLSAFHLLRTTHQLRYVLSSRRDATADTVKFGRFRAKCMRFLSWNTEAKVKHRSFRLKMNVFQEVVMQTIKTSCCSNGSDSPHRRRPQIVQSYSPDGADSLCTPLHGSLGLASLLIAACWSVQPFLLGSRLWRTHRQTARPRYVQHVAIAHI